MDQSKYFCYIDESGDSANPIDSNGDQILRSSLVYTIAAILVDEKTKLSMEKEHEKIIKEYFGGVDLPSNFYLHYNELRQNEFPYNTLKGNKKLCLTVDIFKVIQKSQCVLFSSTLDLESHYKQYSMPIHPQVYTLTTFLERLLSYMNQNNIKSVHVEYERFNHSLRDNCIKKYEEIKKYTNFRTKLNVSEALKLISNGDPCISKILQFADFWAFIPYSKKLAELNFNKFKNNFKENEMNMGKNGNYFIN